LVLVGSGADAGAEDVEGRAACEAVGEAGAEAMGESLSFITLQMRATVSSTC
jgi:hypothetical protein